MHSNNEFASNSDDEDGGLRASKSGLLFDTSFNKFQWDKLEELTLSDCRKDIQPSMLRTAKETITTLEFVGSTNFKNLKLLLVNCKALSALTLFNITLIKAPAVSTASSSKKEEIKLTSLTQLSLNGLGPLTQDEQYLLGFFTRQCLTPNLSSVAFELRQNPGLILTALNSLNGGDPDSPVLAEFLAKNRSFLSTLVLERTAISINVFESSSLGAGIGDKLRSIRLKELTCSMGTVGIDRILCSQKELQALNCYSSPYARTCHFDTVVDAITRCAGALQAVRLSHKVIFNDSDVSLGNVPPSVAHNCAIYKDCANLCHLSLSLSIFSDPARSRMKPGAICGAHLLPRCLKTIILRFDIFPADQIELFVGVLPQFESLGLLLATGNPEMPFTVSVKWIQVLVDLPNLATFEFSNCLLESLEGLQEYLSVKPELADRLEMEANNSIVYRKIPI